MQRFFFSQIAFYVLLILFMTAVELSGERRETKSLPAVIAKVKEISDSFKYAFGLNLLVLICLLIRAQNFWLDAEFQGMTVHYSAEALGVGMFTPVIFKWSKNSMSLSRAATSFLVFNPAWFWISCFLAVGYGYW